MLIFLGSMLLLAGGNPVGWELAMPCCGAFDAQRFVAAGIVGDSFERIPLACGYATLDTIMGLPMVGGAVLGGILFRTAPSLPSVVVIAVAASLLVLLAASSRRRTPQPAPAAEQPPPAEDLSGSIAPPGGTSPRSDCALKRRRLRDEWPQR